MELETWSFSGRTAFQVLGLNLELLPLLTSPEEQKSSAYKSEQRNLSAHLKSPLKLDTEMWMTGEKLGIEMEIRMPARLTIRLASLAKTATLKAFLHFHR